MRMMICVSLLALTLGACAASTTIDTPSTIALSPTFTPSFSEPTISSLVAPTEKAIRKPTATLQSASPTETRVVTDQTSWPLIFQDEFDGKQLDTRKWDTQLRWGRTNPPELQFYSPNAFVLQNSILGIKAEKRQAGGQAYTSGAISSFNRFKFTYGYIEAKAKAPKGRGLWPALWLLADNEQSNSEIDIMEILGDAPWRVHMTLHYDDVQRRVQEDGASYEGLDFSQDFHIFAVDWSSAVVIWYIDGVERFRVTQHVPREPMFITSNLAIGGKWPGYPDNSTNFPALYEIDYIRVYKR